MDGQLCFACLKLGFQLTPQDLDKSQRSPGQVQEAGISQQPENLVMGQRWSGWGRLLVDSFARTTAGHECCRDSRRRGQPEAEGTKPELSMVGAGMSMPSHIQTEVGRGGAGPRRGPTPLGSKGGPGSGLISGARVDRSKPRQGTDQLRTPCPQSLNQPQVWDEFATKPKMTHICFTVRKMRFESKP